MHYPLDSLSHSLSRDLASGVPVGGCMMLKKMRAPQKQRRGRDDKLTQLGSTGRP